MTRRHSIVAAFASVALAATLISSSVALAGGGNSLNAKSCQKNGWQSLVTTSGATFANESACVSYAAKGGVLKKPQTISFTSANPSPVTIGSTAYTPTASATSGLAVTITLDATSTGCSLASGSVSFTAAGTCVIDANQAGNATYNPAAQVQQTITINPAPAQALCESLGGTYGPGSTSAGTLWSCSSLPAGTSATWYAPLLDRCSSDGGTGFGFDPGTATDPGSSICNKF